MACNHEDTHANRHLPNRLHLVEVHEHHGKEVKSKIEFIYLPKHRRLQKTFATGENSQKDQKNNRHDRIKRVLYDCKHVFYPFPKSTCDVRVPTQLTHLPMTETLIQEDLNQGSDQDRSFPKKYTW